MPKISSISFWGRFQFSVEKANMVQWDTPRWFRRPSRTSTNRSAPAACPAAVGRFRVDAHLEFPSQMNATCLGTSGSSSWLLCSCTLLPPADREGENDVDGHVQRRTPMVTEKWNILRKFFLTLLSLRKVGIFLCFQVFIPIPINYDHGISIDNPCHPCRLLVYI